MQLLRLREAHTNAPSKNSIAISDRGKLEKNNRKKKMEKYQQMFSVLNKHGMEMKAKIVSQ